MNTKEYYSSNDKFVDDNQSSTIVSFTLPSENSLTSFICTGDAEKSTTNKLSENVGYRSDVLREKVSNSNHFVILTSPHHGAETNTDALQALIGLFKPNVLIVSAGSGSQCQHPHKEFINLFDNNMQNRFDEFSKTYKHLFPMPVVFFKKSSTVDYAREDWLNAKGENNNKITRQAYDEAIEVENTAKELNKPVSKTTRAHSLTSRPYIWSTYYNGDIKFDSVKNVFSIRGPSVIKHNDKNYYIDFENPLIADSLIVCNEDDNSNTFFGALRSSARRISRLIGLTKPTVKLSDNKNYELLDNDIYISEDTINKVKKIDEGYYAIYEITHDVIDFATERQEQEKRSIPSFHSSSVFGNSASSSDELPGLREAIANHNSTRHQDPLPFMSSRTQAFARAAEERHNSSSRYENPVQNNSRTHTVSLKFKGTDCYGCSNYETDSMVPESSIKNIGNQLLSKHKNVMITSHHHCASFLFER